MLTSLFAPGSINLDLAGPGQDEILWELVRLLPAGSGCEVTLHKLLKRREALGSTGVGRGVAIPHTRCPLVGELQLAFGRRSAGIEWSAIDNKPTYYFFLIVAPPIEVSNEYLGVLGRIAGFVKEPDVPQRLSELKAPEEFLELLTARGL